MVRPVIIGCRTADFSPEQLAAFREFRPYGLTIFQEPCRAGPEAVRHVIRQFREATGRRHAPAFIDMEGGAVNRMKPSFGHGWRAVPAAGDFAELALRNQKAAREAVYLNAQLIAAAMREIDVTVNYAPVVDVYSEDTFRGGGEDGFHAASGDLKARMLGGDARIVAMLGRAFCLGMMDQGVVPVIKHIPGYGRVKADPHYSVTKVDHAPDELEAQDFFPFRALNDMPAAMTGHVTFTRIDPENSATLSPAVIDLIREKIGFENILITDAIEMSAVWPDAFSRDVGADQFNMPLPKPGMIAEITRRALAAGCDLVLHGDNSRDLSHTVEMMEAAAPLDAAALARADRLLTPAAAEPFDPADAERRLEALLDGIAD